MKRRPKRKSSRQEAIYQIALAGISAAVALLLVWLSVLVRFSTIAFYVAAGVALMVPLTKKYYISSVFAYVVSSVLAFVIAGDIFSVVGYVAYFGPMSIATAIMYEKKVKWYFAYPAKIAYINGALALMYFVCGTIMIDSSVIGQVHYAVIAVVGTIALLLIDFVMQRVYRVLIPVVSKAVRSRENKDGEPPKDGGCYEGEDDDLNPFEGDSPFNENPDNDASDSSDSNGIL